MWTVFFQMIFLVLLLLGKLSGGRLSNGKGWWLMVEPWWWLVYQNWREVQKQRTCPSAVKEEVNKEPVALS